ncbi:MAG: hypothetical protein COB36_09000 [Alphaproteobacteria bacterium]|nr:MAG: hypothetical protein COB36_09000 [Alphaproteobacteria bacterium]
MRNKINLSENFRDKSVDGFVEFHDGALKAQDNPDFMNSYKDLLAQNDRVLYLDDHRQVEGKEFMASDQHMSALEGAGYEFYLVEYLPSLNPIIESYERGEVSINDVSQAFVDSQFNFHREVHEKQISSGIFTKEMIEKSYEKGLSSLVDAVENGHEHNIKVRFFDDISVIGQDMDEKDENAHIDDPVLRRDDSWDPYIESLTKGAKAVVFIGAGHVATSYGIDEYMEARGYKVGTVRISPEISDKELSVESNEVVTLLEGQMTRDPDGYDPSDFVVDLFYHDTTKTIEWQKIMEEDEDLLPFKNDIEQTTELESQLAEDVISSSSATSLKL